MVPVHEIESIILVKVAYSEFYSLCCLVVFGKISFSKISNVWITNSVPEFEKAFYRNTLGTFINLVEKIKMKVITYSVIFRGSKQSDQKHSLGFRGTAALIAYK